MLLVSKFQQINSMVVFSKKNVYDTRFRLNITYKFREKKTIALQLRDSIVTKLSVRYIDYSAKFLVSLVQLVLKHKKGQAFWIFFIQGDSFGTRPKKMRISQRLFVRFWTCIYDYILCFMKSMSILEEMLEMFATTVQAELNAKASCLRKWPARHPH